MLLTKHKVFHFGKVFLFQTKMCGESQLVMLYFIFHGKRFFQF